MVSIAAISASMGAIVVWQLAMVAVLRLFDVKLPFSLAFYVYPRREHELFAALNERRKDTFVFISGFLMFACALFVGLTTYDYVMDCSVSHPPHGPNYFVGSAVAFVGMIVCGIWSGTSSWNKYRQDASPRS
jgi:fucose 4-O-acetylase-like acetyltransferase